MIYSRIQKKISVCMATFNGEKYIVDQIKSILKQIGENDEIIISDDGSNDNTLNIISEIKDNRINTIKNNYERGYTKNFENAIFHSTGDIIFLSDQDDVWKENKVNIMVSVLDNCDLVVSDALFVDEDLNELGMTYFGLRGGKTGFINNLYKLRYLGACLAFRREIVEKILPFPPNYKLCTHDMWITLIAELFYDVKKINEPLILYRRHADTTSTGGNKSINSIFRKFQFRLYVIFKILERWVKG